MRVRVIYALLACSIASASLVYSQATAHKCVAPPPDPALTAAQQKLAADGYLLACESANAYKVKEQNHAAAEVDEAIADIPAIDVPPDAPVSAYKEWLHATCPRLNENALPKLRKLSPDDQLLFLRSVYGTIQERGKCT